ncbi:hypothetical protein BTZ20_5891 [Rhodococcus sp. MTM3W5.2]|nr:hypothetical protein BTZ20_5891 [Rhodococcus sp. MTM3W5.2]
MPRPLRRQRGVGHELLFYSASRLLADWPPRRMSRNHPSL